MTSRRACSRSWRSSGARKPRRAGSPPASRGSSPGCGMPSTAADRAAGPDSRPPVFLSDPAALAADVVVLDGPEGRHAATVRRLGVGERADLTDGAGLVAECVVTAAAPGALELSVLARRREPRPDPALVVAQALPKGEHGPLAVDLMTEGGVDVIVPWAARRSVPRWEGARGDRALARWGAAGGGGEPGRAARPRRPCAAERAGPAGDGRHHADRRPGGRGQPGRGAGTDPGGRRDGPAGPDRAAHLVGGTGGGRHRGEPLRPLGLIVPAHLRRA